MSPRSVSAEEAVRAIKPGSSIFIGESCGEPQTLVDALVADKERLRGSRLIECRRFPGAPYAKLTDCFRILTLHVTNDYREAVRAGQADFVSVRLSEAHTLFRKEWPLDVAMVQVAPPDARGQCSLSVGTGFTRDSALHARMIIAEVNRRMPRAFGDNSIPLDAISYTVETSRQVLEYCERQVEEEEKAVGRNAAQLVDDGSVLAVGIGGISDSLLAFLDGKRNIGIQSGIISDGMVELMKKGSINNVTKSINNGVTVGGVAFGTEKLFSFINENPRVEVHPFRYTHDVRNMARIAKFTAINSAVEVDLTGQVNAESIGPTQISAIGGQADFGRGACLSEGGRSIIALSSATRGGKVSKIVAGFKPGTVVSTARYDVHFVVTEYGVAELWGKTMAQRADALISVAHPRYRDDLRRAAREVRSPRIPT